LDSYLGMHISRDLTANTLTMSQPAFIAELTDKFASSISSEFPLTPFLGGQFRLSTHSHL